MVSHKLGRSEYYFPKDDNKIDYSGTLLNPDYHFNAIHEKIKFIQNWRLVYNCCNNQQKRNLNAYPIIKLH